MRTITLLTVLVALTGCSANVVDQDSANTVETVDSGAPETQMTVDSGTSASDAGVSTTKTVPMTDSGIPMVDAGSPSVAVDSGAPVVVTVDAGTTETVDSGSSDPVVVDSGTVEVTVDSGAPVVVVVDSGAPVINNPPVVVDSGSPVVCQEGTTDCQGSAPRTCTGGQWVVGTACPFVCTNGTCGGVCTPGDLECADGSSTHVCGADGQWSAPTACAVGSNETATCSLGTCGGTCTAGFVDCDGNAVNGCESNPTNDSNNCGACGHSCGGGTCVNSVCQAATVGTVSGTVTSMTMVGSNLYWTTSTGTVGTSSNGSTTVLVKGENQPHNLTTDGSNLYWTVSNGSGSYIHETSLNGGSVASYPDNGQGVGGMVATGSNVVWTDAAGPQHLWSTKMPVGAVTEVENTVSIRQMTTDGANVYWTTGSNVQKASLNGGSVTTLATGNQTTGIATDGSNVYFADMGTGTINKVSVNGGAVTVLANTSSPNTLTADGNGVYWIDGTGSLNAVSLNGGSVRTLMSGVAQGQVVTDGQFVYLTMSSYNAATGAMSTTVERIVEN